MGMGIWTPGLSGRSAFEALLQNPASRITSQPDKPQPEAIPARERRRASELINLAVEVTHQACDDAQQDKTNVASVFASAMGDTQITDYMCAKLTEDNPLLSPTKFHNSVHNAASGYWTISAGNRTPSTFVGGYTHTFGSGLLEAATSVWERQAPVALVVYDVANDYPLRDICAVDQSLGLAIVVAPKSASGHRLHIKLAAGAVKPMCCRHKQLDELRQANPIGEGLALLEAYVTKRAETLAFATSNQSHLNVTLGAPL